MTKFAGKLWVVEADGQIVKLDLTAFDDISVGYGVVGRVHEGARLEFARRGSTTRRGCRPGRTSRPRAAR